MKSTDFITESVESTPGDVKANHPEIYQFFQKIGARMSFDNQGKVGSYDTDNSHFVVVLLQPTAGMDNTIANMEEAGVKFERAISGLTGDFNGTYWSMEQGGASGNISEKYRFAIPLKQAAI